MSRRPAAGPRAVLAALLGAAVLAAAGCGADTEPGATQTGAATPTSTLSVQP
jgi:hypothetical protein